MTLKGEVTDDPRYLCVLWCFMSRDAILTNRLRAVWFMVKQYEELSAVSNRLQRSHWRDHVSTTL